MYLSPNSLPILSLFSPSSTLVISSTSPWLSPVFNIPPFSLITTTNLSALPLSTPTYLPLHKSKIYDFTNENNNTPLTSNNVVYDPTHPVLEPNFTSSDGLFD